MMRVPRTTDGVLAWLRARLSKELARGGELVELRMSRADAVVMVSTLEAELEQERERVRQIRAAVPFDEEEGGLDS